VDVLADVILYPFTTINVPGAFETSAYGVTDSGQILGPSEIRSERSRRLRASVRSAAILVAQSREPGRAKLYLSRYLSSGIRETRSIARCG
jgi:hypothetical protein